jgi:hypothetical protein
MCEKMKIYDDARLLGGWANHEEARWNKGGGDSYHLGRWVSKEGVAPKQVMEVEIEGNVCEGWRLLNDISHASFKGRKGMEVLGSNDWSCRLGVKKRKKF